MSKTFAKLWQDHKDYVKAKAEYEQRKAMESFGTSLNRFNEDKERRDLAEHMYEMMLLAEDEMNND